MKKLTQNDLWLLEVIGEDRWTISELYRFGAERKVSFGKIDNSLSKLLARGDLQLLNKRYFKSLNIGK